MKKYTLSLFVVLSLAFLLSLNVNSARASNCASGDLFNSVTGQACGTTATVVACPVGDLFNSVTGQRCTTFSTPTRLLMFGLRGDDVKNVQQTLKNKGYSVGVVDGIYGIKTAGAVRKFQEDNYLTITGNVDVATLVRLNLDNSNPSNPPSDHNRSSDTCPSGQTWNDSTCITVTTIATPSALPSAEVNTYYQTTFNISGKTASQSAIGYTWNVVDGALPAGLWISASADIGPAIIGTPTVAGTYHFTLNATNSLQTNTKQFTLVVAPL